MEFLDRDSYIQWLTGIIRKGSLKRAFEGGVIEHFGMFEETPPFGRMGYITRAMGKYGKDHIVAVTKKDNGRLGVFPILSIPWKHWVGDSFSSRLERGDRPDVYKQRKTTVAV